jgi:hypothetical protein
MVLEPLWKPTTEVSKVAYCARPDVDRSLPQGCCEFIGALVDAVCDSRYCFDGTFCHTFIFGDSKVFGGCPARLEKLKSKWQS